MGVILLRKAVMALFWRAICDYITGKLSCGNFFKLPQLFYMQNFTEKKVDK